MQTTEEPYPATFAFDPPERIANWRPLLNWLLAIPQLLIAGALGRVSQLLAVLSWFVVIFTGRLPTELANFQAMCLRYSIRASTYAGFLREEYPPFTFSMTVTDPGDDPRVRVAVPRVRRPQPGDGRLPVHPHHSPAHRAVLPVHRCRHRLRDHVLRGVVHRPLARWPEGFRRRRAAVVVAACRPTACS